MSLIHLDRLQENGYGLRIKFYKVDRQISQKSVLGAMTPKQIQDIAKKILFQRNMLEVFMAHETKEAK